MPTRHEKGNTLRHLKAFPRPSVSAQGSEYCFRSLLWRPRVPHGQPFLVCSALGASPARFPSDGPSRQAGLPRHGVVSLAGRLVPDDPPGPCARERGVLHHEHAVDEYVRDPGGMHAGIVIAVFVDDGIRVKDHQIRVVALGDDAPCSAA